MPYEPRMTLEVSDEEKQTALSVKNNIDSTLDELNQAVSCLLELRDMVLEQHPSKEDLEEKYRGRFLRHKRKFLSKLNMFLKSVKTILESISKISDANLLRLREILIAEVGELSDGFKAIEELITNDKYTDFTQTLEMVCDQVEKRKKSIYDILDKQLGGYINYNIFGKLKISCIRRNINKRSMLIY